jgi:hypothetical protein
MSSLSSVGQSLAQYLQSLSTNSQSQSIATAAADSATAASSGQQVEGAAHHHHGHGHGGDFQKLEQAVTTALQMASASGSTADPNQTIADAIAQVFGNNNSAATPGSTTTTTPAATTGDGDTDAAGQTEGGEAQQSFFQTLQAFGVTPQQFQQDLLSAIQNAQGGNVDPSTAFQSFPPGTAVDAAG